MNRRPRTDFAEPDVSPEIAAWREPGEDSRAPDVLAPVPPVISSGGGVGRVAPRPVGGSSGHSTPARSGCARTSPLRRAIRFSFADGLFGEIVTACTTGATLTAWALQLGGSPFFIGVLTALPFLAQFLHIPAAALIERVGRRRMALASWLIARSVFAVLVPLPFLPVDDAAKRSVLLWVAATSAVFTVVAMNAWTAWMGDLVPAALRGRYYGRRHSLAMLGGALGSVGAGFVLDHAKTAGADDRGLALSLVALGITIAGSLSTYFLWQQQEPRRATPRERIGFSAALRPFLDPAARPLIRYQLAWNLACALSATFVVLHMVVNLKLGFMIIAAHAVMSAGFRIIFSPVWGLIVDRFGARPVLIFCSYGISLLPFIFLFPTATHWWPIWVDAVLAGTLWSGHAVAIFSLPLRLAPAKSRATYIAAFTAMAGLGYGTSSILGGVIADALPASFELWGHPFVNIHVLLCISFIARFSAATLSRRIVEPDSGAVPEVVNGLSDEVARRALYVGRLATAPLAWGLGWARR